MSESTVQPAVGDTILKKDEHLIRLVPNGTRFVDEYETVHVIDDYSFAGWRQESVGATAPEEYEPAQLTILSFPDDAS